MERHEVRSHVIKSIGFDPATRTLQVEFVRGAVYNYYCVAPETFHELMHGPGGDAKHSIGSYFLRVIKPSNYKFKRIEEENENETQEDPPIPSAEPDAAAQATEKASPTDDGDNQAPDG